jgi:GT2 family glycosyltransferase
MTERVCAIVLDYRAAGQTAACLRSLDGQGLTTVYLVDNSESRVSSANLRSAIEASKTDFAIIIVNGGENLGFAKGVNFAIRHDLYSAFPHDYYLLLNNDAIAGPAMVQGLIRTLKSNPNIALVSPRIVSHDTGREYGIWYHRYLGLLLSKPGRFRFHYFTGCCLFFRKELVNDKELFDEAFFMYGEDAELGWRLAREGKHTACAEDVYVKHEYGPSLDRSSFFYEYHMARAHLLLSLKTWKHVSELPLLLLSKMAGLIARAIARCCRYHTPSPLAALSVAWLPSGSLSRRFARPPR